MGKLRAYTCCVGIAMSISAQMIAQGKVHGKDIVAPEIAFEPDVVFRELKKRQIAVHEKIAVV